MDLSFENIAGAVAVGVFLAALALAFIYALIDKFSDNTRYKVTKRFFDGLKDEIKNCLLEIDLTDKQRNLVVLGVDGLLDPIQDLECQKDPTLLKLSNKSIKLHKQLEVVRRVYPNAEKLIKEVDVLRKMMKN